MMFLSDNAQTDIIEAFKSTSRYLDDLLNIDNPIFEAMVTQIYPTELRIPKQHFFFISISRFQMVLFHQRFMIEFLFDFFDLLMMTVFMLFIFGLKECLVI